MLITTGRERIRKVRAHLIRLDPDGTLSSLVAAQLEQSLLVRGYTPVLRQTMDHLIGLPIPAREDHPS